MIDALSSKLTSLIKNNLPGISDEKAEIIDYGFKMLLYEVFATTLLFAISIIFGVFSDFLAAFLVFGSLRTSAGGAHAGTRLQCFIFSATTLMASVYLSEYISFVYPYLTIPVLLFSLFIIYKYAPGDTEEKPILSKKMIRRMRVTSYTLVICIFFAALAAYSVDRKISCIITLSAISPMFMLTPLGYKILRCKRYKPLLPNKK